MRSTLDPGKPIHWRLLSGRLLGYASPKWCLGGETVEWRVHSVEPYKLTLWRYGARKEFIRNVGWYDNHGPRASMQTVPDVADHVERAGAVPRGAGGGGVQGMVVRRVQRMLQT